ncbi:putative arginine N-methyltransferase [Leishmania infantum JPCM5]|uniref:Arginine_N-methyltransferase_-_putative n=2 Tax=Leishmania infantum TaxID=5671 RepID=A0A6L0WH44_LEIIN|nr:putative arginine N-methyltransferase [Leishmania infantum JPCM5]CAC9439465.1 arginine_N-methyltransferase_-_putative [Leishmania infantum]CBZ08333.1 putative arginine N-methyltransferase [Leishmania infantum JPCM5]SUZ38755.1 arginine_N-methyltransferase_-_putative [Leishmania infantum]|eukprot:XP_003392201.1 putative arginine N-methyltransferase [Leishmania infantum JPCM5]
MPAKRDMRTGAPTQRGASRSANACKVVLTESLLATDAEKHPTSKSLYGDSAARISSNISMIHDHQRLRAYEVIFRNVRGKTLLHLGCGMGLYTMLAARGMAKMVIGVDSSAIVDAARVVAEQNGLKNILFIRGRLCDALHQLPADMKFDYVLCEWMGPLLLNERVLTDALYARDHLLTASGALCPNRASLHVVAVSDYPFRLDTEDFWSNVYGFQMEPMKELVRQEVEMCAIPGSNIVSAPCLAHTVHMDTLEGLTAEETATYEAQASQAAASRDNEEENPVEHRWVPTAVAQRGYKAAFTLSITRNATVHYLTFYLDAAFTSKTNPGANFVLAVRPGGENNWTEVSVGLREPLPVNAGEKIQGTLRIHTPADKGGKITVVEVTAKTAGQVAAIETSGTYYYQSY